MTACPSTEEPGRLEHLLIPELGVAFVTSKPGMVYPGKPYRRVRLDALSHPENKARLRFRARMTGAVSYTHLGVYKRQVGRLVTVDDDGEEIASLDVAEEVRDVSACGRYLSVLYADRLVVYNRQLQVYATLHGPEHTREVLTRADGSVLMIGADSAELFLP